MQPKVTPQPLTIGGTLLRTNPAGLVSLNDLHAAAKAAGQADGKADPREWQRKDGAQFIEFVAGQLNVARGHIYAATRGKGGGTWAHWQIALAYAKYLSPALHMQVNEVFARFKAGDVTLAADIAERASPEKAEWLARRTAGIVARKGLTSTLARHGVQGKGYADCTNAIYVNVLGAKKSQVVQQRGLPAGSNLRDHMDAEQLVATAMSEIVARKRIVRGDVHGNDRCAAECFGAARSVMQLVR
jgi:hypothetical protein